MAPLRALGPVVDLFQPMPYTMVQTLIDGANPYGRRNYWRAHNADNVDEPTIDTMLELAEAMTSPFAALLLLNLGGAISRVSDDATALGGRAAPFAFHLNTMWEGEEHDDAEHRVDTPRDRGAVPVDLTRDGPELLHRDR